MNKYLILVIDDEPEICKLLEIALENNDYKVYTAATAKEGFMLAVSHQPELILLDIGLPDKNGHDVLKELRTWYNKSIIILSALNNETDIVQALDNGATDYLTKPFRTAELLARIRLSIRRNQTQYNTNILVCVDLEIDMIKRLAKKNNQLLKLTTTEFNLLSLFARNEGKILTHQYILREIWGSHFQLETQYLRVFVGTLRKKIEDRPNQPKHIITENGIGYRFV